MRETDNIEEMIPLYYEGLLSKEERELVEQWINESTEHEKTARQIAMIYLATDTSKVLKKIDTDKAYSKVKGKIRYNSFKRFSTYVGRAAIIILIPLIGYMSLDLTRGKDDVQNNITVFCIPGSITSATLPDGTIAHLNSGSTLTYPSRFAKDKRQVSLEGEAYFEVTKDKEKHFLVNLLDNTQIEVLGTKFNVKAYKNSDQIITTLTEGRIRFHVSTDSNRQGIDLKPGDRLKYYREDATMTLAHTDGKIETCWKDGKIIFEDTRLDEVINILRERFNIDIKLSGNIESSMSFTGEFQNRRLEEILNCICLSSDIKWKYIPDATGTKERSTYEIYR